MVQIHFKIIDLKHCKITKHHCCVKYLCVTQKRLSFGWVFFVWKKLLTKNCFCVHDSYLEWNVLFLILLVMILVLRYLLIINLVTFGVRWWDKRQAIREKWRVREKDLLWLIGLGGVVGALLGMQYFRHKTIKGKFLWKFWLIAAAWIIFLFFLLLYGQ